MRNRRFTSDLGRCSEISSAGAWFNIAATEVSAVLFVSVLFFIFTMRADATVRIDGIAPWLAESAGRSMGVVYGQIQASEPVEVKEELLKVVAGRLFLGYAVEAVSFDAVGGAVIKLRPADAAPKWKVSLTLPALISPTDAWFASDTSGMADEILSLINGAPAEVLSWGDLDLKREVELLSADRVPGWRVALMARSAIDGWLTLDVNFLPEQPLTLAVTTKINSSSIPALLHSNLKDDMLKGYAPVIGIPVKWLEKHSGELAAMGRDALDETSLVKVSKAESVITALAGVVSKVDVELESRRYAGRLWMAVYAGAEDRYPEVGIHLGRRIQLLPHWDMELYGELILRLNDWELEKRVGLRWPVWRGIWVGGEWSGGDDMWWGRLDYESWARRPYAWLRLSEGSDINAAVGYHINDYISIELHYDSRYEDELNLRALLNL